MDVKILRIYAGIIFTVYRSNNSSWVSRDPLFLSLSQI